MHQAGRSSDENKAEAGRIPPDGREIPPVVGEAVSFPESKAGKLTASPAENGQKFIRRITTLIIVASAVIITLYVWGIIERHPRTDDATARANVVGIAPRVAGQILKLNVQDNQAVKEGDVLFEIDPEDYRLILAKAKAELAALDHQIAQAHDTLRRLEPLLPKHFTTA